MTAEEPAAARTAETTSDAVDRSPPEATHPFRDTDAQLPPEAAQGRLFLSYKREEQVQALALHEELERRGVGVWIDREGIPPGTDWSERVGAAITNARAMVAMVSPLFLASVNCRREIEEAEHAAKRVVPVMLDPTLTADDLPSWLRTVNWIDWRDGVEGVADDVVAAVDVNVRWLDEHARLHTTGLRMASGEGWSVALRGRDLRDSARLLDEMEDRTAPPFVTDAQRALVATSRLRRRVWAGGLGLGLLVIALVSALFLQARAARTLTESQRLAARATALFDEQADLGLRVALHADQVAPTEAAYTALVSGLTWGPGLRDVRTLPWAVDRAALGDAHDPAVVVDDDGTAWFVPVDDDPRRIDAVAAASAVAVDAGTALVGGFRGEVVGITQDGGVGFGPCSASAGIAAIAGAGELVLVATEGAGGSAPAVLALDADCRQRVLADLDRPAATLVATAVAWAAADRAGTLVTGGDLFTEEDTVRTTVADPVLGTVSALAIADDEVLVGWASGIVEARPLAEPSAVVWRVQAHADAVTAILPDDDGGTTTALDGTMRTWSGRGVLSARSLRHVGVDGEVSQPMAVARDGDSLTTVARQGLVLTWSTVHDSPLVERISDTPAVGLAAVDGRIVSHLEAGVLGRGPGSSPATALTQLGEDGLVAGFEDGSVATFRAGSWDQRGSLGSAITHVAGAADAAGPPLAAATDGADLLIVGDDTVLVEGVGRLFSLAVLPDGTVVGGADGTAHRWSREGDDLGVALDEHRGTVDVIGVTPDGSSVISAGDDRLIRLWDADTLALARTLVGHDERVLDLAVSPDGRRMASLDEARQMLLWDLDSGTPVAPDIEHPTPLLVDTAMFLGADDLLTAGPGVFRWQLAPDSVRRAACTLAEDRALSPAESAQILAGRSPPDPCD